MVSPLIGKSWSSAAFPVHKRLASSLSVSLLRIISEDLIQLRVSCFGLIDRHQKLQHIVSACWFWPMTVVLWSIPLKNHDLGYILWKWVRGTIHSRAWLDLSVLRDHVGWMTDRINTSQSDNKSVIFGVIDSTDYLRSTTFTCDWIAGESQCLVSGSKKSLNTRFRSFY